MKAAMIGAAAGLSLLVAGAGAMAQTGDFAGRLAFQTVDLDPGAGVQLVSGAAVATSLGKGAYQISLLAMEYDQGTSNDDQVYATQDCMGVLTDGEMRITCQIKEALTDTYQPDSFVLRQNATATNVWEGQITSGAPAKVIFLDLD
jgi:hypothetical protein